MKQVQVISKKIPSKPRSQYQTGLGQTIISSGGGGSDIDLSPYMLLRRWLENFEEKTDANGTPYLLAKKSLVSVGGLTAYAGESVDVPSIFDDIPIDNDTIYWDESAGVRVLKAKGGGGEAGSVAWGNITDKPSWIGSTKPTYTWNEISNKPSWIGSTKPSYNWSEIGSKPTTLGGYGITDAYTKTDSDNRFVNVSGDTMTGHLIINGSYANILTISDTGTTSALIGFKNQSGVLGYIGVSSTDLIFRKTDTSTVYKIWHEGNDGAGSGLEADLLDGKQGDDYLYHVRQIGTDANSISTLKPRILEVNNGKNMPSSNAWYQIFNWGSGDANFGCQLSNTYTDKSAPLYYRLKTSGTWGSWNQLARVTDNVASATKLQTARTIWGQSFDGTGNVSGELSQCTRIYNAASNPIYLGNSNNSSWVYTQDIASSSGYDKWAITINGSAWFKKVNIGYTYSAEGTYSLNVNGLARVNALMSNNIRIECDNSGAFGSRRNEINNYNGPLQIQFNTNQQLHLCYGGGNVGIGTASPEYKLDVNGITKANQYVCIHSSNQYFQAYISVNDYITGTDPDYRWVWYHGVSNMERGFNLWSYDRNGTVFNQVASFKAYGGNTFKMFGNILATGGVTCYSSDQRAKTVIENIKLSLKQIANAPTIRFKWNDWKIKDDGKTHIGGIAQYMQALLPETVVEADGMLNLDYATTGYIFAVQTARYLLKTDTEVEKLKKRVKKLEKQLKQLGYEEANIMDD